MLTTMMMTDQMLDLSPSLSSEVPMMHHTINDDASQQVILVQVNPGETFTIRTEDGNLQCIQGPAEVPMMSPNGSIPPIHVPPGYVSQVLEDNTGVRRVVVTPLSECFAPGYSPALSVSQHLHPSYLTHPYFLQASHTYYPPLSACDVLPHYLYQHRLPPVYPDEIIPLFNVSTFMTHEEYCKPPPKKLKQPLERTPQSQGTGHTAANSYSKSHTLTAGGGSPDNKRTDRRAKGSPNHADAERHDEEGDTRRVPAVMSGLDWPQSPQVCNVQSCSALVSWTPVSPSVQTTCCSYELQLKEMGHDGKYKIVYCGEELQFTLTDLRPATDYHVRVNVVTLSMKGQCSEAKAFTTHCAPPDVPLPPRLAHRSKSSLTLQWKPPVDNGSKITNYVLVWDEGKKNRAFCEVYVGHQRHCKVTRLSPASGYMFRLAALNDTGNSGFSPEVVFYTSGCLPQASFPPQLVSWGPSWVMLEWTRPNSCRSEEKVTYILEMQEESKGLDFQAVYSGSESSQKVTSLQRNTQYSFRLITCSGGLCSAPSSPVVCKTTPDRPGPPLNLSVYDVFSHRFSVAWELSPDNGGCGDLTYVLQLSEETSEDRRWETLYKGPERKHVFQGVKPATSFVLRVSCVGEGGQSPWCESVKMRTLSLLPERSQPPRIVGTCTHEELTLQWDAPVCAAAGERVEFSLEMCVSGGSAEPLEVFRGPHTQCTVGPLLPGTTYRFQVRAQNDAGYGPYSECMELSTAAGPPAQCDPPEIIVTSHTCAVVKWQDPQNTGGSGLEVSEYRLDWGRGTDFLSLVYRGTETCFRICNLEAATDYCCRVQAVNQVGAGPHSELVTCRTPAAVPDAVSGVRLLGHFPDHSSFSRSSCLALTWDEPHCNGADIRSYTIIMGDIVINSQNPVCHIIQDLLPDSEYSLQIRAENEMGPGPFSQSLTARTRPRPPSPPPLECVAAGPQSLKLRWGFRNTDSPTYILEMEDRSQRFVAVYRGPSHSFKIQRLSEFCCYRFRIQAVSMAGKGPFSETCSFSTTKSLPPTPKAPEVEQLEGNSCEVTWERIPPMRGDRVSYLLQVLGGRETEFRQVYKGEETSFTLCGLQRSAEYRLRVLACRRCTDTLQDLCSSFSASTRFSLRRLDAVTAPDTDPVRPPAHSTLTDEKLASVIVLAAAALSVLAAFLLQLLV